MSARAPWVAWCVAAAVAAGALALDAKVERSRAARLSSDRRIGRFVAPEQREKLRVAGLRLVDPAGNDVLYVRENSIWRCPAYFDAVASSDRLDGGGGLISSLVEAQGAVHSDDAAHEAAFGLGAKNRVTVLFHGPNLGADPRQDVQLSVELGSRFDTKDGGYVRMTGSNAVWAIDRDPWAALEGPRDRPPLLDPEILPKSFPSRARMLHRVRVERGGEPAFTLRMEEIPRDPTQPPTPEPPKRRFLMERDGQAEAECVPNIAFDYLAWWQRAEWKALDDARKNPPPEAPAGRVTFLPKEGAPTVVVIGAARADGTVPVWNPEARLLCIVAREVAPLLLARPEQLLPPATVDPWQPERRQ